MFKFRVIGVLMVLAMLSLMFGACTLTGVNLNSVSTSTMEGGNFRLLISDEQNDIIDFETLNVTISRIGVHQSGESGNWTEWDLGEFGETVNLTALQGSNATAIWSGNLTDGVYNKVFIYVSNVSGVLKQSINGDPVVKLPGGKMQISKSFEVISGNVTEFVYDITVIKAGKSGKYILKPQIGESGADIDYVEVDSKGKPEGKGKPDKPGKSEKQSGINNSDRFNGIIDNATGTSWKVLIKGEIRTVDVSDAEIEGEPDPGDPVKIEGVEVDGIIVAEEVEIKEPEIGENELT